MDKRSTIGLAVLAALAAGTVGYLAGSSSGSTATGDAVAAAAPAAPSAAAPGSAKPALVVVPVQPVQASLPVGLVANGSVAAWQEASIGAEAGGLRLKEVRVNVGDAVRRGQVLAEFADETPAAELAQHTAALAEAEAALAEAGANAGRARSIEASGALSAQQIHQFHTAEKTAEARVEAARAALAAARLRLRHTRVTASDDGAISFRAPAATVGAVVPQGQELFRLVRQNRLEWRGEVTAASLADVRPGQAVRLTAPGGRTVTGRVRVIAPTVDPQTRNALVYVDLPTEATAGANAALKAGMFARGEFEMGERSGLTLPRQAVVVRDGYSYVFRIGADGRVVQTKVEVGRRSQERVEITGGIGADTAVAGEGAGFLNDGDLVQVTTAAAAAAAGATPAAQR